MNFDPSIVSALPIQQQNNKNFRAENSVEMIDPSILSAVPAGGKGNAIGSRNKFLDPCIIAAQPGNVSQNSIVSQANQENQVQKQQVQQLAMQFMAAQIGQQATLEKRPMSVQVMPPPGMNVSQASFTPMLNPIPGATAPHIAQLPLEIAQQQLQQQQQLARMIQLQQQQQQQQQQQRQSQEQRPPFLAQQPTPMNQQLQQLQVQQMMPLPQQNVQMLPQQNQQMLLQQQQLKAQQLQLQQRQLLVQGQQALQTMGNLPQQQLLMYDQQQLAQLQPHQLQYLQQQLQQQIQLQLQQQQQSQHMLPEPVAQKVGMQVTPNGIPVEPGVFGFPPGVTGLPQQLAMPSVTSGMPPLQMSLPTGMNAIMPSMDVSGSFLPMGINMQDQQRGPSMMQEQRQSRPRRHLDQQTRQEQQRMQFYVNQEASFEPPIETLEKISLPPARRATKALDIVDPKTNTVIQLSGTGGLSGVSDESRSNGTSKAIPIIDPKTNAPISEQQAETNVSHQLNAASNPPSAVSPEKATVNSPYSTSSPEDHPKLNEQ